MLLLLIDVDAECQPQLEDGKNLQRMDPHALQ